MNQKKAKQIRRRTRELMLSLGMSLGEGHNEYEQVKNCTSWERANNPDGTIMRDQDGEPLMMLKKNPGTVQLKWRYRLFYKFLKKMYKHGEVNAHKMLSGSEEELKQLIEQAK